MKTSTKLINWKSPRNAALLLLTAILALASSAQAGFAPYPFSEGFEAGINTNYWTMTLPWGPTWEESHSGGNCLGSNPWNTYSNNVDRSATLGVDLRFAVKPVLSYWQFYSFEPNQDYGFLEVSRDQGANWTRLSAVTSLSGATWTPVQADLTSFAGAQVLIRFRIKSDGANRYSGWYIDDLALKENTAPVIASFFDNVDGTSSPSNWQASVWQQVSGSATSGSGMSWRCLVGNGYHLGGGLDVNCPLTLVAPINLGAAVSPKLSFWWRAGSSQPNNTLYAQVSTDGEKNWTTIWSWNSYWYASAQPWSRVQVDLNSYVGITNVGFRFLAYQEPNDDFRLDFQVDEILVEEAPTDVALSVIGGTDPRRSALLNWSASAAGNFAYYAIYRDVAPNVSLSDLLVATISNRNTLSFQDTNLNVINQTYYYRVFVWNSLGLHNWGTNEVSYQTTWGRMTTNGFPLTEGFESGDANWGLDQPWAITTEMSHSGSRCLASNPGTNYGNNVDVSAYIKVDLTSANRPMLSFWQHYAFEPNQDFGFVEVSPNNGASWTRLYGVTSQGGAGWVQAKVDMGSFAGTQAIIRFRVKSDGQNPYSGWYIDDIEVKEVGAVALGFPFSDYMDSPTGSPSNWLSSTWQQAPSAVTTNGTDLSWRCQIGSGYHLEEAWISVAR